MTKSEKSYSAMFSDSGQCIGDPSVIVESAARAHRGRFSKTNTPLRKGADPKNICAQRLILDLAGESYDLIPDKVTKGWDFQINDKKIKVMGAKEFGNLLIKERKRPSWADIYVLCWIVGKTVHAVRWCGPEQVQNASVTIAKVDGPYQQKTHHVPYTSMSKDLRALRVELGLDYGQTSLL